MKPTTLKLYVDDCGTAAIEFAILSPVFLGMVIGILGLGLLLFVIGGMHYAVEQAARCASVRTTVCTDQASVAAYAQSQYLGPGAPQWKYNQPTKPLCGNSVSATLSYTARLGLGQVTIPLSATACFPG